MNTSTITVTGKGFINVKPDVTRINLTLKSLHQTYKDAYNQAKSNADNLKKIMNNVSLGNDILKTLSFDIDKKCENTYDEINNKHHNKILGYELDHRLKIDLNIDNVIIAKLISLIGKYLKHAEINIGYTVKETRPYQLELIENAIKDAKEKANIICEASNCLLGTVKNIEYGVHEIHLFAPGRMIHNAEEAIYCNAESLDITPDDLAAYEEVTITWNIK